MIKKISFNQLKLIVKCWSYEFLYYINFTTSQFINLQELTRKATFSTYLYPYKLLKLKSNKAKNIFHFW